MNFPRNNITPTKSLVDQAQKSRKFGQKSCVVWLTGLSGSGKSTIARALEKRLFDDGRLVYVLDGDNVRHGLNSDLGFSPDDRRENIRRVAEVALLFADAGFISVVSFISPYRTGRALARSKLHPGKFVEVYVKASLEVCEQRDPKGLYRKARSGELQGFTGIDAPYEEPLEPEIVLDTSRDTLDACVDKIVVFLRNSGILEKNAS